MAKNPRNESGEAAEYYVLAELRRRGFQASLAQRGSRGIDILCASRNGARQIGIQVKSKQGRVTYWLLTAQAETLYSETLYYVFVNLKGEHERPDFYVVPSEVVAQRAWELHQEFLAGGGRDNNLRGFPYSDSLRFWERWDLLPL